MNSFEEVCSLEVASPHLARHCSCFGHFQFDTSVKAIHYRSLSSVITNIIPTTSFWIITPRIVIKVVFGLDREYIHNRIPVSLITFVIIIPIGRLYISKPNQLQFQSEFVNQHFICLSKTISKFSFQNFQIHTFKIL